MKVTQLDPAKVKSLSLCLTLRFSRSRMFLFFLGGGGLYFRGRSTSVPWFASQYVLTKAAAYGRSNRSAGKSPTWLLANGKSPKGNSPK